MSRKHYLAAVRGILLVSEVNIQQYVQGTYGFVNMMSEAPRVHLVMRVLRWYRRGRMPQARGSSILYVESESQSDSVGRLAHTLRYGLTLTRNLRTHL